MADLSTDLATALESAQAAVAAILTAQSDVVEDPAWTAVKEALTGNGWTAPEVELPADGDGTVAVPVTTPTAE